MALCNFCGADAGVRLICPNCGDLRLRSLQEIENMRAYFSVKAAQYDELDAISAELERLRSRRYGGYIGAAIACAILALTGISFLYFGFPTALIGTLFFCIASVAFAICYFILKKINTNKQSAAACRKAKLNEELLAYYCDYGRCCVSFEHTTPITLDNLYHILRTGRAQSFSDAISLLFSCDRTYYANDDFWLK